MDYSLLIGIHKVFEDEEPTPDGAVEEDNDESNDGDDNNDENDESSNNDDGDGDDGDGDSFFGDSFFDQQALIRRISDKTDDQSDIYYYTLIKKDS